MIEQTFRFSKSRNFKAALNELFPLHKVHFLHLHAFDVVKLAKLEALWFAAKEPILLAYSKSTLTAPFVFSLENDSIVFSNEDGKMTMVVEFHPDQPDSTFNSSERLRAPFEQVIQTISGGCGVAKLRKRRDK